MTTSPVKVISLTQAKTLGTAFTERLYPAVPAHLGAEAFRGQYPEPYPLYPVQFEGYIYSVPPELYRAV